MSREDTLQSTEKKAVPSKQTPAQVMYIGPTILRPVLLVHRKVYLGGIPAHARQLADQDKDLAGCFVELAEAGRALRELEGYPGAQPGDHTRRFTSVRKRYLEVKQ